MRLITLNIWGGYIFEPLIEFIRREKSHTDIFCFQEVFNTNSEKKLINREARADIHTRIAEVLPEFAPFFSSAQDNLEPGGIPTNYHLEFGLSIFFRKEIEIKNKGNVFVYRDLNACINNDLRTMGRNAQYIQFNHKDDLYSVVNFHGLWNGQGKSDTEDRLAQSRKLRECMDPLQGKKILCGDFNLLPDTESLKIAGYGMRDLIAEYNITSTRSSLYDKELKFADYIFVTPDVVVEDFCALSDEVSDHLALNLTFK